MWAYKESLTTKNSIKFQTIERIPNKYGNNKKKRIEVPHLEYLASFFLSRYQKKMPRQDNSDL